MLLPKLSEEDPAAGQEGTIDPLGLYSIADGLALKLIPGVRERQLYPRFLTASAVALGLCSNLDPDTVASDNVSEPRMVFEWYLVEGLTRKLGDTEDIRGLPGREKAKSALRDGVPLSAKRYLKAATVFGFQGVYQTLARNVGIEDSDQLGPQGRELLDIWRREQNLGGFFESSFGEGARMFGLLSAAVEDGLARAATDRSPGWEGWQFFADHLAPHRPGPAEAERLWSLLLADMQGFRREVLSFLVSEEGRQAYVEVDSRLASERVWDERPFHRALALSASAQLRALLHAIEAYERLARLLHDAFEDCLYIMTKRQAKVALAEFAESKAVQKAAHELPSLFPRVFEALTAQGFAERLDQQFADLAQDCVPEDWVAGLLEHHRKVQYAKKPNGKAPWCERFDDGSHMIRPAYRRERGALGDESYVHSYRTGSLWSFARDLGKVT